MISTPFGLYNFKLLPFGIKTAPFCFQNIISGMLGELFGIHRYMDDILVTDLNKIDFTRNLNGIFKCLFENGLRIKGIN